MENAENAERIIFELLYLLKRQTDKALVKAFETLWPGDFNITFMPYFMSIGMKGISNHDLVSKIMVTKQGVSKTIKELERLGLVYSNKNESDARSRMIFLTQEGIDLYHAIKKMGDHTTSEYKKLLGRKRYDYFIESITMMSDWHLTNE